MIPTDRQPQANSVARRVFGQPAFAEAAGDETRDREHEWDREPDETEVQQWRVKRHEGMVLEQRVGAVAVDRWGAQRPERVGRPQHEREEEECDDEPDEVGPCHHRIGGARPEAVGDEGKVAGEHESPEQDRAFERGPQPGDRKQQRRRPRVVLGDIPQREVVSDERPLHGNDREDGCQQNREHEPASQHQQPVVVTPKPDGESADSQSRRARAERQGEDAEKGLHWDRAALGCFTFGG